MDDKELAIVALTAMVDQMGAELKDPATSESRKIVLTAYLRELYRRLKTLGIQGIDPC